ncbi:putative Fanconi anemia group M protein [Scophthalmus maximus]|uniref:Putative Fanconi anemia group M protein n=1 Tax=Scophthalmus maximus TaxID=52904 RepID=A0A2U9CIT8_SCOMX|nr:putative Fanconi anemia group M protein [Scophthalmus maximus]
MSNGSNQRTLFQTWGAAVPQNQCGQPKKRGDKAAGRRRTTPGDTAQVAAAHPPPPPPPPPRNPLWDEIGQGSSHAPETPVGTEEPTPAYADEDDDDDLMVVAVYEAEKGLQLENENANLFQDDNRVGAEGSALSPAPSGGQTYPDFPGFDSSSARVWIYPTNYPIREYQLRISEAGLFQNTLVCLPTGLGKTFIAAVVMYNFYRWYPSGKIVFMAPTKPLVAQQIEACYKVMGIPQAHMAELTGSTAAKQRQEVWRSKRVFFLTPQVMVNDLSRGTCPALQVKCVVIDEAHKALGNHAYCQVIRQLGTQTLQFRILALSATPGGDSKSVQSVISNLLISHIELRSEESPDIQAHSHQRIVEKMVVPLGEALSAHQARYLQGECHYEEELLPYRHKADSVGQENYGLKKQKRAKTCSKTNNKPKVSPSTTLSDVECINKEAHRKKTQKASLVSTSAVTKKRLEHHTEASYDFTDPPGPEAICPLPSKNDCPEADMDDDCAIINEEPIDSDNNTQQRRALDEDDVELQAMFYLPKWDSAPPPSYAKPLPERYESLKFILANVAELLSRSPPSPPACLEADMAAPSLPPSNLWPPQPFQVSFTLDVDDDDNEEMMSDADGASPTNSYQPPVGEEDSKTCNDWPHREQQPVRTAADSPTWDEVFGDEEVNDDRHTGEDSKETDAEMYRNFKSELIAEEAGRDKETENENTSEVKGGWLPGGVKNNRASQSISLMDDSMDLFGDDEAFLQMTIPDISTPGITPRTSPCAGDISISTEQIYDTSQMYNSTRPTEHTADTVQTDELACTKHLSRSLHAEQITEGAAASPPKPPTESFESSHDYFPVNFDLGYSLVDSEDDAGTEAPSPPCMLTSPRPKKQSADTLVSLPTVSNSSTPHNSFTTQRRPAQRSESKLSTPQMLPEQRNREMSPLLTLTSKDGALPSPITSAGARRTLMPGLARPHAPSLLSSSKRKRSAGPTSDYKRGSAVGNESRLESVCVSNSLPRPVVCNSDSDDEVVILKRRPQNMLNPLSSPEVSKISDVDSPVVVNRKLAAPLNTSDETDGGAVSDDDFQNESVLTRRTAAQGAEGKRAQRAKAKSAGHQNGRQFLQEEAELSEDTRGADISSDEEDGEEQNQSLDGFVVDSTQFSQGLNDSEMHGVYLKSVKSPAVHGKFKMSYRHHLDNVFSQVPEMDETYAEDSFVVGSEVEEVESGEDEAEDIELMPEDSYMDGRRQYATRRRVFLHKVRERVGFGTKTVAGAASEQGTEVKTKRTRIIRINDSSDEETGEVDKERSVIARGGVAVTLRQKEAQLEPSRHHQQQRALSSSSSTIASKVSLLSKAQRSSETEEQQNERCLQRLENQHLLSDELDFEEGVSLKSSRNQPKATTSNSSSAPAPPRSVCQDVSVGESPAPPGSVCILADSRCISTGVELMTSLRQRHAATVHVCSLDGSYFVVSNRMAVERHSQSDLAAMQNRKRLVERVTGLQRLFERVCLIVEKERTKPGEAARPFQRTRYYDSTLTGLVRSGVRLLWSDGAEQSAAVLADLARLEQRKGQGIGVPLKVKGQHRQQALQLYLNLPSVSYVHALNMSHNFSSIAQLMNSSVEAIQKGGCMSPSRAEEIYRFLRYPCDTFLMST